MRIRWETYERTGQSVTAMVGRRRVGQVVRYDTPAGWQAFVADRRVEGGPWPTAEEAEDAFEAAWAVQRLASRRPKWPTRGRARGTG